MFRPNWRQHGAARRRELVEALDEPTVRSAVRHGLLQQPWRGVMVDASRALDPVTRAAAGLVVAGGGAVVSHSTAAALHGCGAADKGELHITVPYENFARSRRGLIVHHDRFADRDVDQRVGMPVLALPAVLAELLCVEKRWVALATLDQALAGLPDDAAGTLVRDLARRLDRRDDRRGVPGAHALLDLANGKAESPQESRLRLLVVDAGFPLPTVQHPIVTVDGRCLYVLDLAWPEVKIALEYDGYEAHEDRGGYDAERDRRMEARGWITVRVRKEQLSDAESVRSELHRAFRQRGHPLDVHLPTQRNRRRELASP